MLRKTVSLTSFLSFSLLLITSIVLYFEPHGRVAYWGDWRFLGLSKGQWDALHISLGVLFLCCGLMHTWYNWQAIVTYMKNRARQLVVLTPPLVFGFALTLYFTVGALLGLPGVQQILDFSDWLKDSHTATYGNPPYGHAELSNIEQFSKSMGFDAEQSVAALQNAGLRWKEGANLKDIGAANDLSPQRLYEIIRAHQGGDPFAALPASPPDGTGKMTLEALCNSYGLDLGKTLERLHMHSLTVEAGQTLKEIGTANSMSPKSVYAVVRTGKNE